MSAFPRLLPLAALLLAGTLLSPPVAAQQSAPAPAPSVAPAPDPALAFIASRDPWLYENSDVPIDRSWTFGTLTNGLRYAVKRNGVPPDQVSIRIRVDAGSLHEEDSERGFAHLIEHLTFRGSTFVPDGEAKRIWQRFGASFGSDSNAQTTPTGTTYKLDLPNANPQVLDESMKILSGMMQAPRFTNQAVAAEKQIVMAELREGSGPAMTFADRRREHFFQGQRLAARAPIGTVPALQAASAPALRAFHDRWYRPENIVISIAGDVDPAALEAQIARHFGPWRETAPVTPAPPFGDPDPAGKVAAVQVEPTIPQTVELAYLRPWRLKADTIVYNEGLLTDLLATQIVNRRLEAKARKGGSFLQAQVGQDDISRSADLTIVSIIPASGTSWSDALRDVRAVIADATTTPPSPADIEREANELGNAFKINADSAPFDAASDEADNIVEAVDIRETVASPQVALDVWTALRPKLAPDSLLAATRRLFAADAVRVWVSTPQAIADSEAALAAAATGPVAPDTASRLAQGTLGFDALPNLGKAGSVASALPIPNFPIEQIELSNGVRALLYSNKAEAETIMVHVRFGRGYQAFVPGRDRFAWSGKLALTESGVGNLGQEELDQLSNGRRIGMGFDIDDDAFEYSAKTRPADLAGQLQLFAAKLAKPRWAEPPVARARAFAKVGYPTYEMSAEAVLQRELEYRLHGGDPRWKIPAPADVEALTPKAFEATWAPQLAAGPVEVLLFGDFDRDAAIAALTESFGALPPRAPAPVEPAAATLPPLPVGQPPLVQTHRGPEDQAAAVIAWPTGGGLAGVRTARKLEVLAEIFKDRLFEGFRASEAASYSPYVLAEWPEAFPTGGTVTALAQVQPENVDRFFATARSIAADLAANPVSDDELKRAKEPMAQLVTRASTGNTFWLNRLKGATQQPGRILALRGLLTDYTSVTAADIQALAAQYLKPDGAWTMKILPDKATSIATGTAIGASAGPAAP